MGDRRDVIRPLSIGETADRAVTLTVRHWRTLFALVLLEALPIGTLRTLLPASGSVSLIWFVPDTLLVAILYVAVILTVVAQDVPPPAAVLKLAAPRFGTSLATLVLTYAWVGLWLFVTAAVTVVAMIPFTMSGNASGAVVAAAVAGGIAALGLLPRAGLVAATMLPIVTLEFASPGEALNRARERVNRVGFLRSSLLGLALLAVIEAPVIVAGSIGDVLIETTHLAGLRLIDELFADMVTLGFGIVLGTVVALEMRARCEGADLEAELDAAIT